MSLNALIVFRRSPAKALRFFVVLSASWSFANAVLANDIVGRKGLAPDQQGKVTSALARNRLVSGTTEERAQARASATSGAGRSKNCTASIGNIDLGDQRPGVKAPKDNIVVIKAPIVNGC